MRTQCKGYYVEQEKECSQLERNFKDKCKEMDNVVVEKSTTINILTQNLQEAQERYRECVQTVESLTNENRDLKQRNGEYVLHFQKFAYLTLLTFSLLFCYNSHIFHTICFILIYFEIFILVSSYYCCAIFSVLPPVF